MKITLTFDLNDPVQEEKYARIVGLLASPKTETKAPEPERKSTSKKTSAKKAPTKAPTGDDGEADQPSGAELKQRLQKAVQDAVNSKNPKAAANGKKLRKKLADMDVEKVPELDEPGQLELLTWIEKNL